MPERSDWAGKRVAVAGFGMEGRSAADFLSKAGAGVEVFDDKPEKDFPAPAVEKLRRDPDARFHFGAIGPSSGFDAIVRSPGIPPHVPGLAAARERGIPVVSPTQIFFDLCPCPIVGVTGTKGKGTTASLIRRALLAAGKDAYLCGNIGAPALDFLDVLTPRSIAVYELSSFQLIELDRSPALAVVLMVTSDHLDFHLTGEEYVGSKANIVRYQKPGDRAVVNIDYPASRDMAKLTAAEVFAVSRKAPVASGAYVAAGAVWLALGGETRKLMDAAEVPLAGAHNLENAAAAALATSLLGVPDDKIVETARNFKALPHRLELVREVGGVKYYDDSIATTPDSAIAAIGAFDGPKIMILGGIRKGSDWTELARALAADPELRAVIGLGEEWPRMKAAIAKTGKKIESREGFATMAAAVRAAAEIARPGDRVILAPGCKSFDMFRSYGDRGGQFAAAVNNLHA